MQVKVSEFCRVVFVFDPTQAKVVMVHTGQVPEELEAAAVQYGEIDSVSWEADRACPQCGRLYAEGSSSR